MECTERQKIEILAAVSGWVSDNVGRISSAEEMRNKMCGFVLELNQRYGADCVREVLAAFNASIEQKTMN